MLFQIRDSYGKVVHIGDTNSDYVCDSVLGVEGRRPCGVCELCLLRFAEMMPNLIIEELPKEDKHEGHSGSSDGRSDR